MIMVLPDFGGTVRALDVAGCGADGGAVCGLWRDAGDVGARSSERRVFPNCAGDVDWLGGEERDFDRPNLRS